ncbi:MAG TPA: hypothetical protein VIZ68_05210, partial [Thermoplasmata archaeon]
SVPTSTSFTTNGTVFLNFTLSYLLKLSIEPTNTYSNQIYFNDPATNTYYSVDQYTGCPTCTPGRYYYPPGDWYFANGTHIELQGYGYPVGFSYWTGSGSGAYNGVGGWANITMNGAINETGWVGGFGFYNTTVNPLGLPSTSVYHFNFDGTPYSAAGDQAVNLSDVGTGAHQVTDAWADSTTAGWMYFGAPTPSNPVITPAQPLVNLTFSYEDVSSPVGTVTFVAQGLTAGTVWTFAFNGTTYSSSTPSLSVSAHPGTYPVEAFPVVAENGSVGYAPSGVPSAWSVTTGQSYTVNYVQAYRVAVTAGNGGGVTGAGTGSLWLSSGSAAQFIATAHTSYAFGGWTGAGLGSYTGPSSIANVTVNGPIVETASFYPVTASRFNLSFTETGLASGTWWTVFLGGNGFSSDQSSFAVQNLLSCSAPGGNYNFTVPYAYSSDALTRYIVTTHLSRTICTTGSTVVNVGFASQFQLTLQATAGGFPEATIGFNTITTHAWVALNQAVTLDALAQPGYTFLGWNGTGPGSFTGPGPNPSETIVVEGPITEVASFALVVLPVPPTFTVTFQLAVQLSPGTAWGITFGGAGYSSTSATLVVGQVLGGTYPLSVVGALSPDGLTKYSSLGNPGSVAVTNNRTVAVSYSTSYWVGISTTTGGTLHTNSGWVTAGGSILLNATANDGYVFVAWTCSAGPSCSSDAGQFTARVTQPITEIASFVPVAPTGGGTTTNVASPSIWSQWTTWIALAAIGLVVGLVVGLLVSRRSGRSPPPPTTAPAGAAPEGEETYSAEYSQPNPPEGESP